jgi:hypothetical protein
MSKIQKLRESFMPQVLAEMKELSERRAKVKCQGK